MTDHTGTGQLLNGCLCLAATAASEQRISSPLGVLVRGICGGQVRRLPTASGCSFLRIE